ncbi:MAG: PIG-L family deacetylase [Cycloclasticus sp.]|nr:PIG-L family deacetylase [Cycloclasticus sp.]
MRKKNNIGFKRKKYQAIIRLGICAIVSAYLLFNGHFLLLLGFLVLLFIVNELFLADHIFYDPNSDYEYTFDDATKIKPDWLSGGVGLNSSWEEGRYDSGLIAIHVRHSISGKFLDPFIMITSGDIKRQQYFERSLDGLRYINISDFINTGEAIVLEAKHCELIADSAEILLFSNPSLDNKKVLIIAPHADDAEIAAFGLYSSQDSSIITITAGEIDAKEYESDGRDSQQASLHKGRLRSWDSIVVPQWAGLKQQNVIQLGYFCMCLKQMHDTPDEAISSKTAGVHDTRVFREFNTQALASDQHGKPTWNALIADLVECIEQIQPDVIVTPHMQLDPHQDHQYSTLALQQALQKIKRKPSALYLYANHLVFSDMFPFGPVNTLASMPPIMDECLEVGSVVSVSLSLEQQRNKAASLAMMHDLQTPLRWKKKVRFMLQSWFLNRPLSPYGNDEYLRKAIRSNELFFRLPYDELR